jgi:hypothetical protein
VIEVLANYAQFFCLIEIFVKRKFDFTERFEYLLVDLNDFLVEYKMLEWFDDFFSEPSDVHCFNPLIGNLDICKVVNVLPSDFFLGGLNQGDKFLEAIQ